MSAHDRDRDTSTPVDPVDEGLAEAFGKPTPPPSQSVLRTLESRTGSKLGVHLESNPPEDAPVKVTEEAKQLREPSGRYQVLGEIGRGAVGVVYKGRDADLGRDVAMKILKEEYAERPDILARFIEEAQIGGQLQHPGIVPVYGLGMQQGERPYFAMKLVKGETLAAHLARRSDPAQDRRRLLGIFEQVCQTVAYAHARRVVHRDLKPANVMIGAFGEVQVVDWGFAKVLPKGGLADEKESMTRASQRSVIETVRSGVGSGTQSVAGSLFGTPAYMPPEQALGDIDRLDQRSDVFGLGAILCEILTGAPPYLQGDGDLVRQAAAGALEGAYERLQKCGADDALVELCIECLSRARRARPESAAELAARVSDYLTSVEERARQAEVRAAKARYRQRTTLVAAAAAFLILVLGASTWIFLEGMARSRREEATQRVAKARAKASGLLGQARAQVGEDLTPWDKALAATQQAVTLATAADVSQEARQDASKLLDEVTAARQIAAERAARLERDRNMLARLEAVRIPTDDDVRATGWATADALRRSREYALAFNAYVGSPGLLARDDDQAAAALKGDIQVELAAALDHWAMSQRVLARRERGRITLPSRIVYVPTPDPNQIARLGRLAQRLDGKDEWRSALRAQLATGQGNKDALLQLAKSADWTSLPTVSVVLLGDALWEVGAREEAVAAYRRGQEQHPTDFGLCFTLALHLERLAKPRWKEAVETHKIAEALRPDIKEVLHRRGMALDQLGRHEDALRVFRKLVRRDPKDPHWRRHVGGSLRRLGRLEESITHYQKATELNPMDALAYDNLGFVLGKLGRHEESLTAYRKAIEIEPRSAAAYNNLATALQALGRLEETIACCRKVVELQPEDASAHVNLGATLGLAGRHEEAIASYRKTLELDPRHAQANNNLGAALSESGRSDEAIAHYRRVIELSPQNAEIHYGLGVALQRLGRGEEAIAQYRKAIAIDPRLASAHYNLGTTLKKLGRFDEAVTHLRKAIEADPRHAQAHVNLGLTLDKLGRPHEAIAFFRKAIEIDPKLARGHGNLGWALNRLGQPDEAIAALRKAIAIDPKNERTYNHLSQALMKLGRHDEAIATLRKAIQINPRNAVYHVNLGLALEKLGRSTEAVAHHRKALEIDPRQVGAHLGLGIASQDKGRYDEALAHYQKALEIDPKNAPVHLGMAAVLLKQRRYEDAATHVRKAVKIDPKIKHELGPLIQAVERAAARGATLREVLQGKREARDAEEWRRAVSLALREKKFSLVVRLTEKTLAGPRELAVDGAWGVYNPACAAALLSASEKMAASERSRVRELARAWLTLETERWEKWLAEDAGNAAEARKHLRHALGDEDFTSVRGEALQNLPEAERKAWLALWQRIRKAAGQ